MVRKRKNQSIQKNKTVSKKELIQELDKADDKYKKVYAETKDVSQDYNDLVKKSSETVYRSVELLSSIKNVPVKEKKYLKSITIQFEEYENSKAILEKERKNNIKETLFAIAIVLFGGAAKYYIDKVSDDDSDSVKGITIVVMLLSAIAFICVKIKNHFRSIKSLSKSLNKAKAETLKLLGMKDRMLIIGKRISEANLILEEDYKRLVFTHGKSYRNLDNDTQQDLGNMLDNTKTLLELLKTEIVVNEG